MSGRCFVGFGLGPIQGGLFLLEAFRSGNFGRYVVAEVDAALVAAVRKAGGRIRINIAHADRIEVAVISGVEMLNPDDASDRERLAGAVAHADDMATALPSVDFYTRGGGASVVSVLTTAFAKREAGKPGVVYTAENNNRAAEILADALGDRLPPDVQPLNTVIGKMSGVVTDVATIRELNLAPMTDGAGRAVLVEAFNHILISRITVPGFRRGIAVFEEKEDLLPFEEAKLYGHNAAHALLGYLAHERGLATMADAARYPDLIACTRGAFLEECGAGLLHRHADGDAFFTRARFASYVDDLMTRMTNPFLRDAVARVIRDPRRKLGWNDRFIGAMRLALAAGVQPVRLALGARMAMKTAGISDVRNLWPEEVLEHGEADGVAALLGG